MTDGVIKGSGNSRYLKTVQNALTLYPTYESFLQALISGTLPIDLNGINAAGWETEGTALNKANLLSDATAAALGLGEDATVDEALSQLHTSASVVKLFDVTVGETAAQIDLDLSGIDLTQYRCLELHFIGKTDNANVGYEIIGINFSGQSKCHSSGDLVTSTYIENLAQGKSAGYLGRGFVQGGSTDGCFCTVCATIYLSAAQGAAYHGIHCRTESCVVQANGDNQFYGHILGSAMCGDLSELQTLYLCTTSGSNLAAGAHVTLFALQ